MNKYTTSENIKVLNKILFGLFLPVIGVFFAFLRFNKVLPYVSYTINLISYFFLITALWQLNKENKYLNRAFYLVSIYLINVFIGILLNIDNQLIKLLYSGAVSIYSAFYLYNIFWGIDLLIKKNKDLTGVKHCFFIYIFYPLLILIIPLHVFMIVIAITLMIASILYVFFRLNNLRNVIEVYRINIQQINKANKIKFLSTYSFLFILYLVMTIIFK